MIKNFLQFREELTLRYSSELNPKLFERGTLKPHVREALVTIAKAWAKSSNIPEADIHDVVMTGGNANYNYTDYSDIDVHLVVDYSRVIPDKVLASDYLFDKKTLWTFRHGGVRVAGYPVELYAQDVDQPFAVQQGLYSLVDDRWLRIPSHSPIDYENDQGLKTSVDHHTKLIDQLLAKDGSGEELEALKQKFYHDRTEGLRANGEGDTSNLTYKELRNRGYVDRINQYLQSARNRELSLGEASEPQGHCYQYAYQEMKNRPGSTLVHGAITHPTGKKIQHAWVEHEGKVYDWQTMEAGLSKHAKQGWPHDEFHSTFNPVEHGRYSREKALVTAVRNKHYGPWD